MHSCCIWFFFASCVLHHESYSLVPSPFVSRYVLGTLQMYLYDVPSRRLSPPLTLNIGGPVRTVTWAPDMQHLALTSKHSVVLLRVNFAALSALPVGATEKGMEAPDPAFKVLASLHENIRVKGGVWDPEFGELPRASTLRYCPLISRRTR